MQRMQCMNGWAYSQISRFPGFHQLLEGLTALSKGSLSCSKSVTAQETSSSTKAVLKAWSNLQKDQWISQDLKIRFGSLKSLWSSKRTKFKKCSLVSSPAQCVPKPVLIKLGLWQAQELICNCLAQHWSILSPFPIVITIYRSSNVDYKGSRCTGYNFYFNPRPLVFLLWEWGH